MRTLPRPSHPLDGAALVLLRVEETIALVARATPKNAAEEVSRLTPLALRGGRLRPAFVYDERPDLSGVRSELERLAHEVGVEGRLGALHGARARELELDARMAEHVGTPAFLEHARKRFSEPSAELGGRVTTFIEEALAGSLPAPDASVALHRTDDHESSASLVNQLRRRAIELAIRIRLEIRPRQLAVAATGHGIVGIRPGVRLSASAGSRVVVHELLGHALPRARSLHAPLALLRAGTQGSEASEEGRALLIESRAGLLDRARRRELALRHLAALAVRRGADFHEAVRELTLRGADAPEALEIAVRVYRGGGLAREIAYLPAYHEVRDAFAAEAELERWFERGRVGLGAARELAALGAFGDARPPYSSNSMNTGA